MIIYIFPKRWHCIVVSFVSTIASKFYSRAIRPHLRTQGDAKEHRKLSCKILFFVNILSFPFFYIPIPKILYFENEWIMTDKMKSKYVLLSVYVYKVCRVPLLDTYINVFCHRRLFIIIICFMKLFGISILSINMKNVLPKISRCKPETNIFKALTYSVKQIVTVLSVFKWQLNYGIIGNMSHDVKCSTSSRLKIESTDIWKILPN